MTRHTRPATNPARLGLTLLMMAGLTACGGGGSGDDSGGDIIGEDVARELLRQSGVYRAQLTQDLTDQPFKVTENGNSASGTFSSSIDAIDVFMLNYISDDRIEETFCNGSEFTTETITLAQGVDAERLDTDPSLPDSCPAEDQSSRYQKLADGSYRIDALCRGEVWMSFTITRLRSSLAFDEGSLKLDEAGAYPVLAETGGACAGLYGFDTAIDYSEPNDLNLIDSSYGEYNLYVNVPYQGERMGLSISLSKQPEIGVYTVVQTNPLDNEANVILSSKRFLSNEIWATSGTLEITAKEPFLISGTFDLKDENGNVFRGSFVIDLSN